MTFIAVPIFVDSADDLRDALRLAARAAAAGANVIEWRIDRMGIRVEDFKAAEALIERSPLPSIVTCRSEAEGGFFDRPDAERAALLSAIALASEPRYFDCELAVFQRDRPQYRTALVRENRSTSLILSHHDFAGRPRDLLQRIEAMVNEPACAVVKVAWMARSLRDNLEAFDLLAERKKPMIALCMGRFGLMSRVLAPKFGGLVTFASLDKGDESAPGQPTIDELKSLYRFDSIGRETRVYGVIGWPVEHSQSPWLHNAGFDEIGFDGIYLPLPIPPEWEHFKATVGELIDHPRLGFRGASVTIPHKQHLLRFVEERGGRVDDFSRLAGAANTLIVGSAGGLACANTDAPAIVQGLLPSPFGRGAGGEGNPEKSFGAPCSPSPCPLPKGEGSEVSSPGKGGFTSSRVAILGAGGVARAAVAGLMMENAARITIFNRTFERAEELAREFSKKRQTVESRSELEAGPLHALAREKFDIYINCTAVGMEGGPAERLTPVEALGAQNPPLDESTTVLDTVYTPRETPLIREARARGARIISGIEVFRLQAALQFEMWTGKGAKIFESGVVLEEESS